MLEIGLQRFALDARPVVQVLPRVSLRQMVDPSPHLAGYLDYLGQPLAVNDLSRLILGRPARNQHNTRIVIAQLSAELSAPIYQALLSEGITGTIRAEPRQFHPRIGTTNLAPWLGPVLQDQRGLIQRIEWEHLGAALELNSAKRPFPIAEKDY